MVCGIRAGASATFVTVRWVVAQAGGVGGSGVVSGSVNGQWDLPGDGRDPSLRVGKPGRCDRGGSCDVTDGCRRRS